jgi:pilus assembly protein CpaB
MNRTRAAFDRQLSKTRVARIVVAAVAIISGVGAFWIANGSNQKPPPPPPPPAIVTEQVLVVTHDLAYGAELRDEDTVWTEWPKELVPNGVVRKSETPNAKEEIKGRFVRVPIANGEPLRRERLIESPTTKLMSTIVAPGRRAVAVEIASHGANAAGGFILPNDHVDVIRTFRSHARGADVFDSETIVRNVRVLAMGNNTDQKGNDSISPVVNATLELDPRQTELVVLAQRTGQLTLSLLPMADWDDEEESIQPARGPGPLSAASGVSGGRLTIPREKASVPSSGRRSESTPHQSRNFSPRQVLNAN